MFCPNCGKEVQAGASFCPSCGKPILVQGAPIGVVPPSAVPTSPQQAIIQPQLQPQLQTQRVQNKNEGLAAVLSFLFTGLGQIYNGQIAKGILFVVVGIVFAGLIFVLIGIILYPIFWIYNIYDAYATAKKINAGQIQT